MKISEVLNILNEKIPWSLYEAFYSIPYVEFLVIQLLFFYYELSIIFCLLIRQVWTVVMDDCCIHTRVIYLNNFTVKSDSMSKAKYKVFIIILL